MVNWTRLNDRVEYKDTWDGIELRIPAPRHWWPLVFLPFWWTIWTAAGIATWYSVLSGRAGDDTPFLLLWLCGWFVGWVGAAFVWLWIAFGSESVRISQGVLAIRYDIRGRGWTRKFHVEEVSNLRAAGMFGGTRSLSDSFASIGLGGGVVAFDVGNKTHRFGGQLEERQAGEVVGRLATHLPEGAVAPGYERA